MIYPTQLNKKESNGLEIVWSDGHIAHYQVRNLRLQCHCAACIDEWTREPRLNPAEVPGSIVPLQIQTVGRYALNFSWSDGHNTGYYPFEHLRNLCECNACQKVST